MKEALIAIGAVVLVFVLLGQLGQEPDDGRTTLEFWCYGTGGADNPGGVFWEETGRLFEEAHPGVRVKVVSDIPHGPYNSLLTTRFVAGKGPDVFIVDDGFVAELANEGQAHPLDDFIREDPSYRQEDFPASMVSDGYVGGVCSSIPWYGGFGCLTYRADIFEKAGVRPPTTWDELVTVCRTLQEKTDLEYPFGMTVEKGGAFWMMPWIWQNGGRILSDDLCTVAIDSPEVLGAIRFVHDLMYKHKVMDPSLAQGTKLSDLWSGGKVAFMIDGGWRIARYDILYPDLAGKWDTAMVPAGKHKICFYGGQHLVMNRRSRHPDLAWKFMAFATNAQNQFRWTACGSPPSSLRAIEQPSFREKYPRFALLPDVMRHGRNNPFAPYFAQIWYTRFAGSVLDVAWKDAEADIEGLVRDGAREMQTIVDEYWIVHDRDAYRRQGDRGKETTP